MRMSLSTVTIALVLLLSVTGTVLVTGESGDSNDCVSQQELATVKEEMERKVDQLHSQLHYWQNVTLNILKDHYSSLDHPGTVMEIDEHVLAATIFNISRTSEDIKGSVRETNRRLDLIENSLTQLQTTTGQCNNNDTTGSFFNPAHNCSHILSQHPGSPSGYYWVQSSPGYAVKVYCDMERVCGCDEGREEGGGWMRVADINMTRPNEMCPTGFRYITTAGKTMCGGQNESCIPTTFSTHGLPYSRVCGRIIGYQFGNPNAFGPYFTKHIPSHFMDGIVLTHGSPQRHIWTFTAGKNQYINDQYNCPCNGDSNVLIPPFVGGDYFCDSGHRYNTVTQFIYFTDDPLWDGEGCVSGSCCSYNSPPWFCKSLTTPTTDDIKLQLCINEAYTDEDTPFEIVELYVQ